VGVIVVFCLETIFLALQDANQKKDIHRYQELLDYCRNAVAKESEYFPITILQNSLSQDGNIFYSAGTDTKYVIIVFYDYSYLKNNIRYLRKISKSKNIRVIGISIDQKITNKTQLDIDDEPAFQICRLLPKDKYKIENKNQIFLTLNNGKIIAKFAGDIDAIAMGIIETF